MIKGFSSFLDRKNNHFIDTTMGADKKKSRRKLRDFVKFAGLS